MNGFRFGRVFGIDLYVDVSWVIIAALITVSLYIEFSPPGETFPAGLRWAAAVAAAVLFFGSVLVHELSHSVVALRRGIRVRRIRLFIFGGVSEIEQEANTPGDEFAITIAGPASSLILAGLFYLADWLAPEVEAAPGRLLGLLAFVNLALALFNLLPGFPLDGGRVLRSAVWKVTGSYRRGTKVAVGGGMAVAGLLALVGLVVLVWWGNASGLWYLAIGWFLFQAARTSGTFGLAREALSGMTVGDVMVPAPQAVPGSQTLAELFDENILGGPSPLLPVTEAGRVRGVIGLRQLEAVPRPEWDRVEIRRAMVPIGPGDVVDGALPVTEVLTRLARRTSALVVVADGRVVGTLSLADVMRWVEERTAID